MRHIVFSLLVLVFTVFSQTAHADGHAKNAVFAGGCFWCIEADFEGTDGILDVQSGYAGGHVANPTYEQVSSGNTGHREVVQVTYNPNEISYQDLLAIFWRNIDPFDDKGQFCDRGFHYTAAIYYNDDDEKALAEQSRETMEAQLDKKIVTAIGPAAPFYPAEDYHQDYAQKSTFKYKFYRSTCGRDSRLKDVWGKTPYND